MVYVVFRKIVVCEVCMKVLYMICFCKAVSGVEAGWIGLMFGSSQQESRAENTISSTAFWVGLIWHLLCGVNVEPWIWIKAFKVLCPHRHLFITFFYLFELGEANDFTSTGGWTRLLSVAIVGKSLSIVLWRWNRQTLGCWGCWFESHLGHGFCISVALGHFLPLTVWVAAYSSLYISCCGCLRACVLYYLCVAESSGSVMWGEVV